MNLYSENNEKILIELRAKPINRVRIISPLI